MHSNVCIAKLLNKRRRLNVELKGTAGSPGCDTTYRAEGSRQTRYEMIQLLSSAEWSNQVEVCGSN